MILLRDLSYGRSGDPLIEGASLQLHPGWKIGMIGANGCGKSSFFALLRGELHAEAGDLEFPARWVMAHVGQDTPALPDAALEFVLDGDVELREVERGIAAAEAAHDGELIGHLYARYGEIDGYASRAKAASLLAGLGFSDADFVRPVAEFSGGWRVRLNLGRALMSRSDLLLLDEPTNHLDLDAVLWLETWLKRYPGTLLLISHDRDFLDAVTDHILHFEQKKLKLYTGDYSTFERTRAEHLALQQSMYEKQQREMAHLKTYIDRFRAQATKARQAQSRIKALDRMQEVAAAHVDTPFSFAFREPVAMPDTLLELRDAAVGYGDTPLISGINLTLRPGERIALLGPNGAGKSTLIKLLAGELAPLAGTRREGKGLSIGYFAQHQLEALRPEESPLWHMSHLDPRTREQELRNFLGGFDFRGDMVSAPCGGFSGGEKSRLALALLIWQRPNLLLLDEPTNHLDLEMREALTLALQETDATVVLVSHDRHLLRTTADSLYLVADHGCTSFDGDLDDYASWLATSRQKVATGDIVKTPRKGNRAAGDRSRQNQLGQRRALEKEAEKLEKQLAVWQGEKTQLGVRLAAPGLYAGVESAQLASLLKRQDELNRITETAEARWLEIHELLEAG
ncbi:putative ABC transporter ATP-binding protein YheS [mine drainage metagenome]|uniref:Putative ABC transporter ATP-binding protein YheS n=1 Tax=mine drainage metagenome TaxID=410659 RepID=A0A1J5QVW8_9ZZZZ